MGAWRINKKAQECLLIRRNDPVTGSRMIIMTPPLYIPNTLCSRAHVVTLGDLFRLSLLLHADTTDCSLVHPNTALPTG